MNSATPFSDRFGYQPPDAEITNGEDAPDVVRDAGTMLGYACGLNPSQMRDAVCEVLLKRPDPRPERAGTQSESIKRERLTRLKLMGGGQPERSAVGKRRVESVSASSHCTS